MKSRRGALPFFGGVVVLGTIVAAVACGSGSNSSTVLTSTSTCVDWDNAVQNNKAYVQTFVQSDASMAGVDVDTFITKVTQSCAGTPNDNLTGVLSAVTLGA